MKEHTLTIEVRPTLPGNLDRREEVYYTATCEECRRVFTIRAWDKPKAVTALKKTGALLVRGKWWCQSCAEGKR